MTSRINSASRINNIITKALERAPNEQAIDAWAKTFNIVEDRVAIKSNKITFYLQLLHQEVSITRKLLEQTTLSENLYIHALSNLEDAFSAHLLMQNWSVPLQYLNPATLTSLSYWVDILPDEEKAISEPDLEEIIKLLDELELLLEDSKLPESLIIIIKHLTGLMRDAINKYPIAGAKALRSAVTTCYGELVLVKEELQNNPSEETSKLKKILDKFTMVVDSAEKVERLIGMATKLVEFFSK